MHTPIYLLEMKNVPPSSGQTVPVTAHQKIVRSNTCQQNKKQRNQRPQRQRRQTKQPGKLRRYQYMEEVQEVSMWKN